MSRALKLEPRCPEPAHLMATSVLSRHMSASSARRASGSAPAAPRTRSSSDFGTSARSGMSDTLFGRGGTSSEERRTGEKDEGGGDRDRVLGDGVDRERRPEEDEQGRSGEQERCREAAGTANQRSQDAENEPEHGSRVPARRLFSRSTALGRTLRSGKLETRSSMRRSISAARASSPAARRRCGAPSATSRPRESADLGS